MVCLYPSHCLVYLFFPFNFKPSSKPSILPVAMRPGAQPCVHPCTSFSFSNLNVFHPLGDTSILVSELNVCIVLASQKPHKFMPFHPQKTLNTIPDPCCLCVYPCSHFARLACFLARLSLFFLPFFLQITR